jgi:hypothetical protein
MKRVIVGSVIAAIAVGVAGLALWPRSVVNAQVPSSLNAEGCTCSRPTVLGAGRDQLSIYYCACPGMQCMVTATAAGGSGPANVVQNCRADSSVLGPR